MKRYIPLIIIEGATVMAVELCGAKLMAPIFGGSIFVWAAILAITLSALAFGYYYGGVLSSKNDPKSRLFQIVLLASIFIALMPFISIYLLPYISYLNFKLAVLLSAFVLIFIPIGLLGCTTPLFVRINATSAETAGLVSGKVYAISTLGGIASTLLCGFVLIPVIGLKFTLLSFAVILFVTSTLVLKVFKPGSAVLLAGVFILSAKMYMNTSNALYSNYSILGEIEVLEFVQNGKQTRQLLINKIVQTEMIVDSKQSTSRYLHIIDSITPKEEITKKALILGLGGGLMADLLQKKNYVVDGVEFDQRIIESAKNYFFLPSSVNAICDDARLYINKCSTSYDLIVFDLFKAEEQPSHTITYETFQKVKKMLHKNGHIIINWHGFIKEPLGKGTQVLLNTLASSGFKTQTLSTSLLEDYSNTLILAEKSAQPAHSTGPINTDDAPYIELANARANLSWRLNYLRFYQNKK